MYTNLTENNIYYDFIGQGDKIILFLHGWGCKGETFLPIIQQLPQQYKALILDFQNHGRSAAPNKPFYVEDFAMSVVSLLQQLELKQVYVVAHSFGARVACWAAAHYPELFKKIIITGGAGVVLPKKSGFKFKTAMYKIQKNILYFFSRFQFLQKSIANLQEALVQKYGSPDYKSLSPSMRKTFVNVIQQDLREYYPLIQQSTLLIWGSNDTETPIEAARIMESLIPDAAVVEFENKGHFAFLEESYRFTKILEQFFSED